MPSGKNIPPYQQGHDEQHSPFPPYEIGQENRSPELLEELRLHQHEPRERATNRKESHRDPQLHVPFTCPPDGPGTATTSENHANTEKQAAHQAPRPEACKDPVCGILQVHGLENGKANHAQDQGHSGGTGVLSFSSQKGLTKRSHQTEARALEKHTKSHPKKEKSGLSGVPESAIPQRQEEEQQQRKATEHGLPSTT